MATRDEHHGGSEQAGKVLQEIVALQRAIQKEMTELLHTFVSMSSFQVTDEEGMGAGDRHMEIQRLQHFLLGLNDLGVSVDWVTDARHFADPTKLNLFDFAGNPQGRDSNQLELGAHDGLFLKVAVDQTDCQIEGLRDELELVMDFNDPVDENGCVSMYVELTEVVSSFSLKYLYMSWT